MISATSIVHTSLRTDCYLNGLLLVMAPLMQSEGFSIVVLRHGVVISHISLKW